uniref:Uncharacterized protein n=1 Tax=Arundo donax TaxID=35708 RepID=A0A0A9GPM5_ARUDO
MLSVRTTTCNVLASPINVTAFQLEGEQIQSNPHITNPSPCNCISVNHSILHVSYLCGMLDLSHFTLFSSC